MQIKAALRYVMTQAWALQPEVLEMMTGIVIEHNAGVRLSDEEIVQRIDAAGGKTSFRSTRQMTLAGNVAIVPIVGVIEKWATGLDAISKGTTGAMGIQRMIDQAVADEGIEAILLDIDSPGGSVAGIDSLGDAIFKARKTKRVVAFAGDLVASAAYWLGAQAEKLYVGKAALAGSIGVYTVMVDAHVMASNMGLTFKVVRDGDLKGAGTMGTPLTDEQIAEVQARVSEYGKHFRAAVARGRGMDAATVKALADGRVHMGQAAVDKGLADGVSSFEQVLDDLQRGKVSGTSRSVRGTDHEGGIVGETDMPENKPADLKALQAAFPNNDSFVLQQLEKGHSVLEAKADMADILQLKVQGLEKDLAAKDAEIAKLKEEKAAAGKGNSPVPDGKTGDGGTGSDLSAREEFEAKVAEKVKGGMSRDKAVSAVVAKHPDLHKAMLDEANAKR